MRATGENPSLYSPQIRSLLPNMNFLNAIGCCVVVTTANDLFVSNSHVNPEKSVKLDRGTVEV